MLYAAVKVSVFYGLERMRDEKVEESLKKKCVDGLEQEKLVKLKITDMVLEMEIERVKSEIRRLKAEIGNQKYD